MGKNEVRTFYLDKENDIEVHLEKNEKNSEMIYKITTPHHRRENLIKNFAKVCKLNVLEEDGDFYIKGSIPAALNADNEEVYVFRLNGLKIANIYLDRIDSRAKVPGIAKALMAQTREYNKSIEDTIIKAYVLKKFKFRTDLHTHMNGNLNPNVMIAFGIKNQIRYPLYYIKKLGLKVSKEQYEKIEKDREIQEEKFEGSDLKQKYKDRKIDDNTFINFADLILNNLEEARYNIGKIKNSLEILKDGQAVFTNLEKLYIYRYVFAKGIKSTKQVELDKEKVNLIPNNEIRSTIYQMIEDMDNKKYNKFSLTQEKLLWVARQYQKQGIHYVEISDTTLVKSGNTAISFLEELHFCLPLIEKETGVRLRFLAAIRRIPLTIIKDQKTEANYLRENLNVLMGIAKSPYVVGIDIVGEEINDISELKPVIKELVEYVQNEDEGFTLQIHAGENGSLKNNVLNSIEAITSACIKGKEIPRYRIGHGLYTPNLNSKDGKELIEKLVETKGIVEFQISSNVRLNNLVDIEKHPIKIYLDKGVRCVQGTDGCGLYGADTVDEQMALQYLVKLKDSHFESMREVENQVIEHSIKYFETKNAKFQEFLNGRSVTEAITDFQEKYKPENQEMILRLNFNLNAAEELKDKIKELPTNKMPIVIAGGSFNTKDMQSEVLDEEEKNIEKLLSKLDEKKVFFVIGHKLQGHEKTLIELAKKQEKKFEIYSIIPRTISIEVRNRLLEEKYLKGVRISTELEELGIYKSFNYEIFERGKSIVVAFDGNSPVSNLIQEANNGKGESKIFVNEENEILKEKLNYLYGYVAGFDLNSDLSKLICKAEPELKKTEE